MRLTGNVIRAFLSLCILLSFYIFPVFASDPVTIANRHLSDDFTNRFYQDVRLLHSYAINMEKTLNIVDKDKILFDRKRTNDFDIREKEKLFTLWANYLDHILAFEQVMRDYQDFYLLKNSEQNAQAFLLAYASYVAKYSAGLRYIRTTIDNELYEKKLDDMNPEYDIPIGMYAKLKWNTIHVKDLSNILAGYQYYKFLRGKYVKQGLLNDQRTSWIFAYIDEKYKYIVNELKVKGTKYFAANGLDILKEKSFTLWFPMQMNVAEWMGDTKVKRPNQHLISESQIKDMQKHLRPGDIIVERRNWYLSNIGLPGFWPHAELFIGTYDAMQSFFDDQAVKKFVRSKGNYKDFLDYLNKKYPEKMKEFLKKAPDGYEHQIIEAVSEGVKFSSLQEATSADYIGVMRPRLLKLDVAKAIDEAFHYLGRPYDFNFDFLTDSSIVCSELIYKIYRKGPNKRGLDLRLREIAGRKALPANDIVEKFDREFSERERDLDFVFFLDGTEKEKRAKERGVSEFRLSYKRLKWDIAQK